MILELYVLFAVIADSVIIQAFTVLNGLNNVSADFVITENGKYHINLTWTPQYTPNAIKIEAINDTCKTSCSVYQNLEGKNFILIPPDEDFEDKPILENRDCKFFKNCWYNIKAETIKGLVFWNKTIHLPACLNGICLCENQSDFPKLILSANVLSVNKINISWAINLNESTLDIKQIHIGVIEQIVPELPWGGTHLKIQDKIFLIKSPFLNGHWELKSHSNFQPNRTFLVRAYLVDRNKCFGNSEKFKIVVPELVLSITKKRNNFINTHVLIFIIIFCLMISIFFIFYAYKKWKKSNSPWGWETIYGGGATRSIHPISMENNVLYTHKEDVTEIKYEDYEICPNNITLGFEIANGAFGRVFKGFASDLSFLPGTTVVAIKKLKKIQNSDEIDDFLSEIETMKNIGHHENVITLLGCCTKEEPLMLIMEYVGGGDLLNYLKDIRRKHLSISKPKNFEIFNNNKTSQGKYLELILSSKSTNSDNCDHSQPESNLPKQRPSATETVYTTLSETTNVDSDLNENELHNFAYQISKGMHHLEIKGITHRDLAARNILITEHKVLKISDFGLSRNGIYINKKGKKRPLRWLSIEANREHFYSNKSDVWAFGIVLWEIGTLGGFPYHAIENEDLLEFLVSGQRLEKPAICTEQLYNLMNLCWEEDPKDRPSFMEIVKFLQSNSRKLYVDLENSAGSDYVFPPIKEAIQKPKKNSK